MTSDNSTNAPQSASLSWLDMDGTQRLDAIRMAYMPGMSVRHIATMIRGANRNAVIGYYHRNPELAMECPLGRSVHAGSKKSRPRPTMPIVKKSKPMPVFDVPASEPVSMRITLDQFTSRSCKWPTHGPDEISLTYFCGHPREIDRSYCPYHQKRSVSRGTEGERSAHRVLEKEMASE